MTYAKMVGRVALTVGTEGWRQHVEEQLTREQVEQRNDARAQVQKDYARLMSSLRQLALLGSTMPVGDPSELPALGIDPSVLEHNLGAAADRGYGR